MDVGEIFDNRYRLVDLLGQGGMGRVYLAENMKLGTFWAIKEIKKKGVREMDFRVEPDILKRLEHPALPRIYDIVEDEESICIIVDYIEGTPLDKKLSEEGRFSEGVVTGWALELCRALEYLHSRAPNPIIYRDMKPSNIILTRSGRLKLVDFGISREFKLQSENDTVYIGTRGYAAPEQYGAGQTGVTSDIYSLGVTLYQLLTGKSPCEPPYEIKPVRFFDRSFSRELESIICKCTRQDPSERYQSVSGLMKDLEGIGRASSGKAESLPDGRPAAKTEAGARPFKKLVLTVWDNAEFGCELAYTAARLSGCSILLIDLDLLSPKADLFLNIRKYPAKVTGGNFFGSSGLNIVMESVDKNYLTAELLTEASLKRNGLDNLFVLTGNYKIENYEYYSDDSLLKLIEKAYRSFDITILLVNRSIYDSFTVLSLSRSDMNIVALHGDVDRLREFNTHIAFLKEKQHIPADKTKFVAFEYLKPFSLSLNEIREATGGNLIGRISYSRKRAVYRNLKAAYAGRMEKDIIREYGEILEYFNILPAMSPARRFAAWLARFPGASGAAAGRH
jgi:hypothetical protein